jgi:hypothetical protein
MKVKLSNSIYQQRGSGYGLTMGGGMEINNRVDGVSGISQAVSIKKAIYNAEKVERMAEAVYLGTIRADMDY